MCSSDLETRNKNNLVTTSINQNEKVEVDDRIRKFIEASNSKREERIRRVKEREKRLLEQIKNSNIKLSINYRRTEAELLNKFAKTRSNVERNIERNSKQIDTETIKTNDNNKRNSSEIHELLARVDEQYSRLKKSIKGVIDEIKKLKIFKIAKEDMMSKDRQTINKSRRR